MPVILHRMTVSTDRRSGEESIKELPPIRVESVGMPPSFEEIEPGIWKRERRYPLTVVADWWRTEPQAA